MQWWSIFLLLLGVTVVLMAIFLTDKTRSVLEKRIQLFVANFFAQPGIPAESAPTLETKETSPLSSAQGITGIVLVTTETNEVGASHRLAWENGFRWMASENGIPFLTEPDVAKLPRYPKYHLIISLTQPLVIPDHPYVLCGPLIDQTQLSSFTQGRVVLNTVTSAGRQAWESWFEPLNRPEFRFEKLPLPLHVELYPETSRQRVMVFLSPDPEAESVQQLQHRCEQQGWVISHFATTPATEAFRHADYMRLLSQASAVVQWLSVADETLPLMEAWACNVPTLVMVPPDASQEFTTFLPCWSDTCGAGLTSPTTTEQLLTRFDTFQANLNIKAPRQYLKEMSAEQWLQRYRLVFQ